ncbi:hypothetical protein AJ80_04515 [Polytolypa hystricis UAMH7299]|uniref:BZIP domain-containing protein n=1 Tax=Polytolypa hystricis (strain UAMH7299) TaxID=1447883 RepID=A0A2B7YCL5_POLH7|nr:hypothetical protein AJ80_04515 [Polytolypa hystricis UAMH7299]
MSSKRPRRKAPEVAVPDISEDAAERKRVLNVLAQRRYRRRKKEHIKALEAQLQKGGSDSISSPAAESVDDALTPSPPPTTITNNIETPTVPIGVTFPAETEPQIPQRVAADLALEADSAVPPASPGIIFQIQEALNDSLSSGAESSGGSSDPDIFFSAQMGMNMQSNFQMSELPPPPADAASTASLWPPLFAAELPSPPSSLDPFLFSEAQVSSSPSNSASELSALTYQFLNNPANETYILQTSQDSNNNTPNLSSALQSHQASTFSFPDDHLLEVPSLTLLRAILTVATRLNLTEHVWSLTGLSPFYTGSTGLSSSSSSTSPLPLPADLPPNFHPTPTQRLVPHHALLDLLPWPVTRDKLIQVFSLPKHLRPASAADPMGLLRLAYDMEDPAEGVRVSGADPFKAEMWEVGQLVFQRWWWAFDEGIVERSNRLRKGRGQGGLVLGVVE